jgi:hypothetical protein
MQKIPNLSASLFAKSFSSGIEKSVCESLKRCYSMYEVLDLEALVHKSTTPREHKPLPNGMAPVLVVLSIRDTLVPTVRKFIDRVLQLHGLAKQGPLDMATAEPMVTELCKEAGYEVRFVDIPIHFHMHEVICEIQKTRVIAGVTVSEVDNVASAAL